MTLATDALSPLVIHSILCDNECTNGLVDSLLILLNTGEVVKSLQDGHGHKERIISPGTEYIHL